LLSLEDALIQFENILDKHLIIIELLITSHRQKLNQSQSVVSLCETLKVSFRNKNLFEMQFTVRYTIYIIVALILLENLIFAARTTFLRKKNDKNIRGREKRWLVFPPNGGTGK
jgi:hypothetical protein